MTNKSTKDIFFGHLFESAGLPYCYHPPTQELIALESIMAAVLPHFDQCQNGEIPTHLTAGFQLDEIHLALKTIEEAHQSEGLFFFTPPKLTPEASPKGTDNDFAKNLQHLVLTLTENCNLRCRYCLHGASLDWVRPHGHKTMSTETALQATRYFLDRCRTDEPPAISFYGGEALLEAELIEAVVQEARKHPKGKEAFLVIDTNGVLLNEKVLDLVAQNQMSLQVSLDGPRRIHDGQRPDASGNGTFLSIMKAIDRLLEMDPTAHERLSFICTVAPPTNLNELDKFFGQFPPYLKHRIDTSPNIRVNLANLKGQDWPASKQDFQDLNEQLNSIREDYYQAVADGKRDDLGPVVKALIEPNLFQVHCRSRAPMGETYTPGANCNPGVRKLHVAVDGRLQPCERTGDTVGLGHLAGGIDPSSVTELQTSFFEEVKANCAECWALRLCRVCYAGWAEHRQEGKTMPSAICGAVRQGVEKDLQLLVRILELPEEKREFMEDIILS